MSWRTVMILLCTVTLVACSLPLPTLRSPLPRPGMLESPLVTPPPLAVQIVGVDDLTQFPPLSPLALSFTQPMDPHSAATPLQISPPVEGTLTWNDSFTGLIFMPAGGFVPGRSYRIRLDEGLRSATGATFDQSPSWEIHVRTAPRVVEFRAEAPNQRRPRIQIRFDRPMKMESLTTAIRIEPPVDFRLEWGEEVVYVEPLAPLTPGVQYELTVNEQAADQQGTPLLRAYNWYYRPVKLIASVTRPARQGKRSTPLTIRFNYKMDGQSVKRAFRVEPAIEGETYWDDTQTTLVVTPTHPLPCETEYTVSFDGVLVDAHGDAFPPLEPLHFTTPPPILSTSPGQGQSISPATFIKVTFDREMDRAATEEAFIISPPVPGTFTWEETTLIFQPDQGYLEEFTSYTVIIATGARSSDGEQILQQPYTWSFQTGRLEDVASFGWGPNAQVVDADGRRAIQFQIFQTQPATLTFELYRLSLEQFLDRYASGFRGVAGEERRPISTTGTILVKQWQVGTTRLERKYGNVQEVLIPADVPPGLYILNMIAGRLNDQLIVVLTRNVIAVKQAEGQLVAWVSDINGRSIPGIEVGVYARNGQLLSQGYTDHHGVYRTRVGRDPQPLIVIAREGEDVTATGLSNEWRSSVNWWWRWWGWWLPAPQAYKWAVYTFTDRPIYRPGQTVFFKSIVRRDDDAQLSIPPAGTPVTVRIRDARNNLVRTLQLATNHFGTVHGNFQLAEGAMLGEYALEVVLDGESHRQIFKVQDYRKPDYQVTITTDARQYVEGDKVTVQVEARYFFGEPVPHARLTLRRYELAQNYCWWEPECDGGYIWYRSSQPELSGATDENGRFTYTFEAAAGDHTAQPHWPSELRTSTWGIEVSVDDGSRQEVSSFAVIEVFNAAELLSVDTSGYFKPPRVPFDVRATVRTIAGEPVKGRVLRLELRRYNSNTGDYTTVVQSARLTTDERGEAVLPFTVRQAGYYQLYVSGVDRRGHKLGYTSWLYVFSDAERWGITDVGELSISADRDTYAPGDTARLLIQSTFSGPALLTFERGTTRREQLIELNAPLTPIEVAIRPDDVPNIFVTVNAWREQDTTLGPETYSNLPDSRLYIASVELHVPATDKILNVTITPDKDVYAPREQATFTIRVTNRHGEPVSAEVSLAVVDEAIFSLSEELSGPIFDAFYFERENIVRTYDSMALRRDLFGGGEGGGGGDGFTAANPRSDLPDTAAWLPVLHTDANGTVKVTLQLPDNLTSWRLTAKATTADTQVGEAVANITTHQPVVVRPVLPRTLTVGDRVELSAIVHNYGPRTRTLLVSIKCDGLEIKDVVTRTIRLAPGASEVVGWLAVAQKAGEAPVTVQARGEDTGDAIRVTLPIRPLAVPDVETQIGVFSGELETDISMPASALDELGGLQIELSRSIAGSILQGLEYLTGYPYGCVEQTMSRALPNAVVGRAFYQLGIGEPTMQADLPPKINAGLQRLYGFQHNDGGWGWWYDDATDAYQTAWVVFGLAMTAEAGYEVDPEVIKRGTDWLAEHLSSMDLRTRAYAVYSMAVAGYGDLTATRALMGQAEELDTFSVAALALALHEMGDHDAALELLSLLEQRAVTTDGMAYWQAHTEDGYYDQKTMASSTRSTALALSAFVRIRPGHPLEPDIVRWLMSRRQLTGWGSTNETSYAVLALTDHLLATEFAMASTSYRVELNGQPIAEGTLERGEPAAKIEIPAAQLARGVNRLRIVQSGSGQLYYAIGRRAYLPQTLIEAAGNVQVTRTYLDAKTGQPVYTLKPGQLVQVNLEVSLPDKGFYIIVEDHLPGGLEALNEGLNTTTHEASLYEEPRYYWQQYGYNHKEVHGGKVIFFITEMPKARTFTYLARATIEGLFTAPPAEVSAMYDMATWGRSASRKLRVNAW
ncbi:MAG: Ig-like domain-containing protein [Anaerolineae bacterium]|nr:Ig-like domain-containing protein [Anaerolineae bacterium]